MYPELVLKVYKVFNVLAKTKDTYLGEIAAYDISSAMDQAKKVYGGPGVLLQVKLA